MIDGISLFVELLPAEKETIHKEEHMQERMRHEKEVIQIQKEKKQVRKYYDRQRV